MQFYRPDKNGYIQFQGLVDDYYAHNMEVLEEYGNPVEKMAWAVKFLFVSRKAPWTVQFYRPDKNGYIR